jgi:hypothetical protein
MAWRGMPRLSGASSPDAINGPAQVTGRARRFAPGLAQALCRSQQVNIAHVAVYLTSILAAFAVEAPADEREWITRRSARLYALWQRI